MGPGAAQLRELLGGGFLWGLWGEGLPGWGQGGDLLRWGPPPLTGCPSPRSGAPPRPAAARGLGQGSVCGRLSQQPQLPQQPQVLAAGVGAQRGAPGPAAATRPPRQGPPGPGPAHLEGEGPAAPWKQPLASLSQVRVGTGSWLAVGAWALGQSCPRRSGLSPGHRGGVWVAAQAPFLVLRV